jgi:hypothetical protein
MEKFLLGSIKKRKDDFGNEIPKIRQKVSSELTEIVRLTLRQVKRHEVRHELVAVDR